MTVIDDKVVAMSFESSKFESGVNKTLTSLDKLKSALLFKNAGKGLDEINKAAQKVQLGHIGQGVEAVSRKLESLRLVAIGVMSQITTQAVRAGASLVKSLTLEPIIQGFHEYATNLNAVQTILANTQAAGVGIKEVNATLNTLNEYSDKTIYNFSQMARNIGTFTAAGVDLKTSADAIKGIANLAALSGSNSEQASTAMYQLSQAIAAGRVSLMDWNSVVNAGMGGTVFQRALAQTAEKMGTLKKGTVDLVGPMKNVTINGESFRNSISAGPGKDSWLTSKVLTNTLKQFTGDLSDAELKAQGFTDAEVMSIQKTAQAAMLAATEVKTLSQVFEVAKETAGSGWAQTFQIIFGNFNEAKKTFTDLSNTINGFINTNADARNKVLSDWKKLGGRTLLINTIKIAFQNLMGVIRPIKDAFRDIFPAMTGKRLFDLTVQLSEFVNKLRPSEKTIDNLRRTFRGLFAALDIARQIIGGVVGVFIRLLGASKDGAGGLLNFTGNIGDFIVKIDEALKKGDGLKNFFDGLGDILEVPLKILGKLGDALASLFGGFSSGGFSDQMDGMTEAMTPFQKAMQALSDVFDNFLDSFGNMDEVMQTIADSFVAVFQELGPSIANAVGSMNFEAIFQLIRTGLFAGLVLMLKNFLGKGSFAKQLSGVGGGIVKNISGSFKALEGSMVALQQNIKAKTLKEIAIAIALLAASVVALSFVDPERLKSSLTAITIAFGQLLGAMAILGSISKTAGFIKMPLIAGSLILLAGAILVLSASVVVLSQLSWEELAKGLTAVGVLLAIIAVAAIPLSANSGGMVRAGIGITAMAVGLRILANAVQAFATMSWGEMAKGFAGVVAGLAAITAAVLLMPPSMPAMGLGLIAIAFGLKILAGVVKTFAQMDWKTMGKGMAGVAAGLLIIAGAMQLMPKGMILQAAGLLIISIALQQISKAIQSMGGMSVEQIAKGLGTLAGALAILAGALYLMSGTLSGAAALAIAASGIALLVPALMALGSMSWEQIIKGLVALGAALAVVGIAGVLMTPIIPALLGLGAALLLIGAGIALVGAGIFLIATGLSALVVAAPTGVGVLIGAFEELSAAIPRILTDTILGLLEVVQGLAKVAPQFVAALVQILDMLLEVIIQATPKIVEAFGILITGAVKILAQNQGQIIQAGLGLLLALLAGIKNNIGQIVVVAVEVIANFISAIAGNIGPIIGAGVKLIVALLKGIAGNIGKVVTGAIAIMAAFLGGIANNLGKVATAGLSILTKLLKAISSNVSKVVKAGTDIIVKFVKGIGDAGPRIVTAAVSAMTKFINAISQNAVKLADEGAKAIINFLNGVADVIENREPEIIAAGARIGAAIISGLVQAVRNGVGNFRDALISLLPGPLKHLAGRLGLNSPSKVFMKFGEGIVEGLALGITANKAMVVDATDIMANGVIKATEDIFEITSPSKVMKRLGKYVVQGFANGLVGTTSEVKATMRHMREELKKGIDDANAIIDAQQSRIDSGKLTSKQIAAAKAIIKQQRAIIKTTEAMQDALTKSFNKQKGALLKKAAEYTKVAKKLEKAKQILADAIAVRDQAKASFVEQFSELPESVTQNAEGWMVDPLETYLAALRKRSAALKKFHETLNALKALGLDNKTIEKLLSEGPDSQAFADAILAGGPEAVAAINSLDSELTGEAESLATDGADALYQAGVDAAQGIVDGLDSQLDEIGKAMGRISKRIINALKRALGIKSPSKEFAKLGVLSMEGIAKGFSEGTKVATNAAEEALSAMKQTMSNGISDIIELDPTITPILDLTQVESEAQRMAALLSVNKLNAAASLAQASSISTAATATEAETAAALAGTSVKFEQNNYSPEALTEIEIYRQTRNQLSKLKSVLAGT